MEDEKRITEFLTRTAKKQKQSHSGESLVVYGKDLNEFIPKNVTEV